MKCPAYLSDWTALLRFSYSPSVSKQVHPFPETLRACMHQSKESKIHWCQLKSVAVYLLCNSSKEESSKSAAGLFLGN
ncbi:hypothetical protein C0J52_10853 [Blattella germanica]|nr:hypothetical protein C0J52_10853 [Blattella germanica]